MISPAGWRALMAGHPFTSAVVQQLVNLPDPYAALGLDRDCPQEAITTAYRELARKLHPDVNDGVDAERLRQINAAYECLRDPARRRAYDAATGPTQRARGGTIRRDVKQDALLSAADFFHGTALMMRFRDPATGLEEVYTFEVPPGSAPGARLRVPRKGGGHAIVRLKMKPGARFKGAGSDLKCDLRISAQQAEHGGVETLPGGDGRPVRVSIPRSVERGEILRIPGGGLPRSNGGRGDLLVRVLYRVEARITRKPR